MSDYVDTCIFCKIAAGELNTEFLVESDSVVAFKDIAPSAPIHVLVIPKTHIESVHQLTHDQAYIWGEMLAIAQDVAREAGIDKSGYRLVTNIGADAGQEVFHLHLHVIGGGKLGRIA